MSPPIPESFVSVVVPEPLPFAIAENNGRLLLDALSAPGLSIEEDVRVATGFLRRYLHSNDPARLTQRWRVLERLYKKRPISRRSKPAGQANLRSSRRRDPETPNDGPLQSRQQTVDQECFPTHPSPQSDVGGVEDDFEVPCSGYDRNDNPSPTPGEDQEQHRSTRQKSRDRRQRQPTNPTSDDPRRDQTPNVGQLVLKLDETYLRLTESTTEQDPRETIDALIKLPVFEQDAGTPRFKQLIEKFVNALFSPASYFKVVESMQNILQISGLDDGLEAPGRDEPRPRTKRRLSGPVPVPLKWLEDGWRQAGATEKLQDRHWARVKHLVLSVQSYGHWLTLLDLLKQPDCPDGDYVRKLVQMAREEDRARSELEGTLTDWKPSSDSRYLQLAVADYLGLPGGAKQWRDFIAYAQPAHVLHRFWGLLAVLGYKTLYVLYGCLYPCEKPSSRLLPSLSPPPIHQVRCRDANGNVVRFKEIGEPLLQKALPEILWRHSSLRAVAQMLNRCYIEALLGPGTVKKPTTSGFMDIKDEGELVRRCRTNANGFVGLITDLCPTPPDESAGSGKNCSVGSIERSSSNSTPTDPSRMDSECVRDGTGGQHRSPTPRHSRVRTRNQNPVAPTPFTPLTAKSPPNNQLPTPGRSGASAPPNRRHASVEDTPTSHARKRCATTPPTATVEDYDETSLELPGRKAAKRHRGQRPPRPGHSIQFPCTASESHNTQRAAHDRVGREGEA
ncbi:MAG: hypothetical protein Q9219_005083 [cf. Caloplaca sp. 3 TL-2023]